MKNKCVDCGKEIEDGRCRCENCAEAFADDHDEDYDFDDYDDDYDDED